MKFFRTSLTRVCVGLEHPWRRVPWTASGKSGSSTREQSYRKNSPKFQHCRLDHKTVEKKWLNPFEPFKALCTHRQLQNLGVLELPGIRLIPSLHPHTGLTSSTDCHWGSRAHSSKDTFTRTHLTTWFCSVSVASAKVLTCRTLPVCPTLVVQEPIMGKPSLTGWRRDRVLSLGNLCARVYTSVCVCVSVCVCGDQTPTLLTLRLQAAQVDWKWIKVWERGGYAPDTLTACAARPESTKSTKDEGKGKSLNVTVFAKAAGSLQKLTNFHTKTISVFFPVQGASPRTC